MFPPSSAASNYSDETCAVCKTEREKEAELETQNRNTGLAVTGIALMIVGIAVAIIGAAVLPHVLALAFPPASIFIPAICMGAAAAAVSMIVLGQYLYHKAG